MPLPARLPKTRQRSIRYYARLLGEAARRDEAELAKGNRPDVPLHRQARRWLARNDLFYLLTIVLHRKDVDNNWLFDRCREVQAEPDGYLDLWFREAYKSTIITFGLTIQDILASHGDDPDPRWGSREATVGIFSHSRGIAMDFLDQIKLEFEANDELKALFPDILFERPGSQSPSWSKQGGITVKRKGNPREATVEAWGLVDGMPTGKHFLIRVYDDVVTEESVATPDQIAKTTTMWELSDNLGTEGGVERYAGSRYALFDTYNAMVERGSVVERLHPCTKDGTDDLSPENCVFRSPEWLAKKRRNQGPYTFGAQMLLDPVADKAQGFKEEWLQFWPAEHAAGLNVYILVDPASGKKEKQAPGHTTGRSAHAKSANTDFTVMEVVGLGADGNYYTLDRIRDRLNLTERTTALFDLHKQWKPLRVGYEEYGLQADIEFIKHVQAQVNYRFDIKALGGKLAKNDRIKRLVPIYEQGRWYELDGIIRHDWEGKAVNLTQAFIREEFLAFPVCKHDDILDAKARILDPELGVEWPKELPEDVPPEWMKKLRGQRRGWMSH